MVRVFSIYQFDGQSIHRIPGDIRSASLIDTDQLALAKSDHVIEIVSLKNYQIEESKRSGFIVEAPDDNNIQINYAFPTVDDVVEMEYCKFGNFIGTIERKISNSGSEHYFCRVYTNWINCKNATTDHSSDINLMTCNVTIRARIAGRVTPSNSNIDCLEVIEIPTFVRTCNQSQSSQPYKLAVCQQTGTLICAKDRFIKFYKFDECVNDNTHFKYIDFFEVPFEVELDFIPTQLSINEHIIGCANSEFMCVFKVSEQNFFNTANSLTTSSSLSVMAAMPACTYIENSTDSILDYQNVSKKFLNSITSNISSTFDYQMTDNSSEKGRLCRDRSMELKPNYVDHNIPMCNLRHFPAINDEVYKDYVLRMLVQVKQHDANDPFQCLVLSPIYSRKPRELDTNNLFRSQQSGRFIGISVLLATVNEGYLYQFSNNEKWTSNESDVQSNGLIASYSFTSPIISVCVTDYVIHALTDHGIETYTHCIGHKLFNNAYEYGLSDDLYNVEVSPRIEEQICLIGLRPFLGVQRMFHTPHNLILLAQSHNSPSEMKSKSKTKQDKNQTIESSSWTLYSLKMSPGDVLYKDFIEQAANHKTELTELITSQNSDKVRIYTLLLSEGHIILRIAKEIYTGEPREISTVYSKSIDTLFLESCHQLADFYVMSTNRDQYCLAYPYYLMGNLTMDEVYNRIMALIEGIPQDSKSMIGAVHTLKSMIIKSTERNDELTRKLTTTFDSNQTFGEKFLELLAKYAPNELASIGLTSNVFRDALSMKICDTILQVHQNDQLSKEDKLILILDAIENNRKERAMELLESFNALELHNLLVANWTLMFETTKIKRTGKSITTFSELTESYLLPASITNLAIRSALLATFRNLLIDTNVLNIELILKLFMDFLASHFGQMNLYMSVQSILENVLEAYFHRLYVVRRFSDTLSTASHEVITKNVIDFHSKSANNNDSLGSTSSENVTNSYGQNSNNSGQKDSLHGSSINGFNDSTIRKHPQNIFTSSFNVDALKILTRIYLSSLKAYTMDYEIKTNEKPIYMKNIKLLRENFNRIYSHHISLNTNCDGKNSPIDENKYLIDSSNDIKNEQNYIQLNQIPILFLLQRPSFLNNMPPIKNGNCVEHSEENAKDEDFSKTDKGRRAIGVVLKLQSLLSSGILTRDILQEVLHFIESNIPFFGLDSFLMLLMPFEICVDFLIEMRPEYLLDYAKCVSTDDQKWQYVLTQITMQFDRIIQNQSQEFYETLLKDHLEYLVHTKRLAQILNIIPIKYFGDGVHKMTNGGENIENGTNGEVSLESENLFSENNNNAIFTDFLKLAIDSDRSERLNEMIKTTGFQLYNTFIGGNNVDAARSTAEN